MLIPNNEGKVCDAVVRLLEAHMREKRADLRHPEVDGVDPPVDLRLKVGTKEWVIEHTRIESFEGQIETGVVFRKITSHIRTGLAGTLPAPACYELHVPASVSLAGKAARRNRALDSLVNWIREGAHCMDRRNSCPTGACRSPFISDDRIRGVPPEFTCEMVLLRWPDAVPMGRKPGDLVAKLICPEELEERRADRLRRAYSDKCPKLERAKEEGARTVLVWENVDIALASFDLIDDLIPMLLAERRTAPDEIYLAETHTNPWWVWLMKHDGEHRPIVGVPEWNQSVYEADKLRTAGIPQRYRDSPQSDELSAPHVSKWAPTTFDEAGLENLSKRRGSNRLEF